MTDEQIIKALECCRSDLGNMCSICPSFDLDNDYCADELHEHALDLINRQQAEIESLKQIIDEEDKKILKLQKRIIFWREDLNYQPEKIKSEAIKEFAERLKRTSIGLEIGDDKKFKMTVVSTLAIDNLVKEMTEVQK